MKQRSILENVLRLLGSQFSVLTRGMERQTPKLSSSQLLSHHVFGQRKLKLAKLMLLLLQAFQAPFKLLEVGGVKANGTEGSVTEVKLHPDGDHMDARTVPCRHNDGCLYWHACHMPTTTADSSHTSRDATIPSLCKGGVSLLKKGGI